MSKVKNTSGLTPVGVAVLIKPYEPELKTTAIVLPDSVKERLTTLESRGIVIEVGASAWHDEPVPRAKPGDRVMIAKLAGAMVVGTADKQTYRVVNDRDIYLVIGTEE